MTPHEREAPSLQQPALRVKHLAADLAYGALVGDWDPSFTSDLAVNFELKHLLIGKWNNKYPSFDLLTSNGYLDKRMGIMEPIYTITQKSFDLIENAPTGINIFISYGRKYSSAFALALQYRLRSLGANAFLDRELDLGEAWHSKLESQIKTCDYFIIILAPETLNSVNVRKELIWAYESARQCIPVWQNDFSPENDLDIRTDLINEQKSYINAKNALIIEGKEKAKIYHDAINSIVNQLGYLDN